MGFFWKDENFRKACGIQCWSGSDLEKSGLEEENVTGLVSINRGHVRSIK